MTMNHSPAHWIEYEKEDGDFGVLMDDHHLVIFGNLEGSCGTCHANAALTAAAPELLEALEDLWQFVLDNSGDDCGCVSADYSVGIYASGQCSHCKAKAIIAKAKGLQS
jgi:hypothetical protein